MPEFWALDGGVLTVDGPGVEAWPPAVSTVAARGWMGRAVLQANTVDWLRIKLGHFDGMQQVESYEHASGPVSVMGGPLYGARDFAYHGEQHAVLWEAGGVGLTLHGEGRSRRWHREYAQLIRFETNGRSVRAWPAAPSDWHFEQAETPGLRLSVGIPGIGVAKVLDARRVRALGRSDRSRRLRVGTVHSYGSQEQQRVLLESGSATIEITLLEATADAATERLAELRTVAWRQ